jgi:hypothetical protein
MAAEDLHRPVGDPAGHLGGVQLGHRALGVLDLDVQVGVDAVRGLVGHQPGRPQLGHRVGQHELDRLVVEDRPAVGLAPAGEGGRLLDQPLGRPQGPGRDHQPFVAEPLVGEAHAVALGADQLALGDADVFEGDHRVMVGVGVAVGGGAHHPDAGGVKVEHEHGVAAGVGPAGQLALEEHVVGVVERGHVPLDAVEQVAVAVAGGRRLDRVDVGAGALLGDGVALPALAPDGGYHPAVQLLLAGHLGQPGCRGVHHPAERVGDPPHLLLDQHLLEGRVAAAAQLLGHVDGLEAQLGDAAPVRLQQPVGQLTAVQLGLDLVGQQLVGQSPRALSDLPVRLRHRIACGHETDPPERHREH